MAIRCVRVRNEQFFARSRLPGTRCEAVGLRHREASAKKSRDYAEGVLLYAVQGIPQIDEEIVKKGHFWMDTN